MNGTSMPKTESDWQAEDDARTLSGAEEIRADAQRLNKAMAKAKQLAEERRIEAEAMAQIANAKMIYKMPDFNK